MMVQIGKLEDLKQIETTQIDERYNKCTSLGHSTVNIIKDGENYWICCFNGYY